MNKEMRSTEQALIFVLYRVTQKNVPNFAHYNCAYIPYGEKFPFARLYVQLLAVYHLLNY